MSTWISDPSRKVLLVALAASIALSACSRSRFGKNRHSSGGSVAVTSSVTTIEVARQNVIIEGPAGFCVDRKNSDIGSDVAFVLLGNCRVISPSSRGPEPEIKALLTASVSATTDTTPTISESVNDMDRFFRSTNGRTALSRESDPATVKVLETFQNGDAFYLRARDTSAGIVPGAADDYWRSYFDLDGQIVSVSVIGFNEKPLTPKKSLETAQQFTRLIKERNGVATQPAVITKSEPVTKKERVAQKPVHHAKSPIRVLWTIGLLRRLVK